MTADWEPQLWLTASEQERMQEWIAGSVLAWQQKWAGQSTRTLTVSIECLEAGEYLPSTGVSSVHVRVGSGHENLQISLSESLVSGWLVAAGLKGDVIEMPRRGPLLERVFERVSQSLAARLLNVDESSLKAVVAHGQVQTKTASRLWLIDARDSDSRLLLCVGLRPALLESWLKRSGKAGSREELQPLHAVFADQAVSLRAVLAEIDIPYAELSQLACGDVLILPSGADEGVSVRSSTDVRVGSGRLGREASGCRAIGLDKVVAVQVAANRAVGAKAAVGGNSRGS
jgi:hypothetical protein